ncbi:MAG: hypothetical protein J6K51_06520 [Clostridia bacterium]|nr:hypothetical protein [Clostridia bacterium]
MKTVFRTVSLVFLCLFVLFTTGCSPREEVGNLAIVTGIFLNYSPESNTYQILAEIGDFSEYEQSSTVSAKWVKSSGETLFGAFFNLEKTAPVPLYFSHAKMLLLGNGFQTVSTRHAVEFFLNSPQIHSDILVCATTLSEDVLQKFSEKTVFKTFYEIVSKDYATNSCQLFRLYNKETEAFFLPEITAASEESISLSTAVFYNHLYVTTYENNEEMICRLLTDSIQNKTISTPGFNALIKQGDTILTEQNGTLSADCRLTVQLAEDKQNQALPLTRKSIQTEVETTLQTLADSLFQDLKRRNQTRILWEKSSAEELKLRCFVTVEESTLLKGR